MTIQQRISQFVVTEFERLTSGNKFKSILPNKCVESEIWHILYSHRTVAWLAVDAQGAVRVGLKKPKSLIDIHRIEKPTETLLSEEVEHMFAFMKEHG